MWVFDRRRPAWAARYLSRVAGASVATLAAVTVLAGPAQAVPASWSVTASPNRGTGTDQLWAVSCAGPKFCMAVGTYGGDIQTLAEVWNGKAWSITPSPSPGANLNELFGVSCTGPSFCVAVGERDNASDAELTLAETWNGKAWSVTSSPSQGRESALFAVSCRSAGNCVAVGHGDTSRRGFVTLAESWNGQAWSVRSSPSVSTNSELDSVSCPGTASCVAVGSHDGTFGAVTLAESWNGTRWSLVATPNQAPQGANQLVGVSCASAASCAAVGGFATGTGPVKNMAESWNGKRWSLVHMPSRGSDDNELGGVWCTSPANCVAAGFSRYGSPQGPGNGQTLIESWNGARWAVTASPNPRPDSELYAVTCTGPAACQAVGYAGKGSLLSDETLVETGS